jgi:DNA-binding NarL/FixJ family response regulator
MRIMPDAATDAPETTPTVTIVIADDHPIVRAGLRQAIETDPSLRVVAEAADGEAALARIREHRPSIAVIDIDMPKLDGPGVARALRQEKLPVRLVFLTIHGEEDLFHAAMDLEARAYLLKESALTEIAQGLRAVAAGQYYVSAPLTGYLVQHRTRAKRLAETTPGLDAFTATEQRVLHLIAGGQSSKEIGAALGISYRTVENHRTNICQKLGLAGPHALLRFALQRKPDL